MNRTRTLPSGDPQLTRRTWLSWLGNATVLALTPDILSACGGDPRTDAPAPAPTGSDEPEFSYMPSTGESEIYRTWQGNTVDPQNLTEILGSWELSVEGLVERVLKISFADLLQLTRQDQVTDFHCVEGWSVLDVPWNGIHINRLIELARPTAEATHLTFHCVGDVYSDSLPLSVAREARTLLAYGIAGHSLPLTHGFPLRLVVPRFHGYKSAKWVKQIVFTNTAEPGFWEQRGYPYEAEVEATRLRPGKY